MLTVFASQFKFLSLQKIEDDGDIVGTSVSISIQVQYDGGGYNTVRTDTISGKSSGSYQRDYVFALTGSFPVDIKVLRNTADNGINKASQHNKLAKLHVNY